MTVLGQKIIGEIRDLAQKNPGRIEECVYVDTDGHPVCIVGNALYNLDLLEEFRVSFTDHDPDSEAWNHCGITTEKFHLTEGLSVEEFEWIQSVQESQDSGIEWGIAVESAEREVTIYE